MIGDELNSARPVLENWHHWMPFAALMARETVPQNRPMATRLVEQAFVGIIAGGGGAYGVNSSMQAVQSEQIQSLKEQIRDTESRLTAQIVELRARQLK